MDIFESQRFALAKMAEHNLLSQGWTFGLDSSIRRFGVCKYSRKRITISRRLTILNPSSQVQDTILHEIAHALAGSKAHHGPAWKLMCIKIGAKPVRCYNSDIVITPKAKYSAKCECGIIYERHNRPLKDRKHYCKCQNKKLKKNYLIWKRE